MKKQIILGIFFFLLAQNQVWSINAPTLTSPASGANLSRFSTTLTCSVVSGATGYQFQLDTQSSFNNPPFFMAISTFSGAASPVLRIGKAYFWRVRCFNGSDTSAWSGSRSFSVVSGNLNLFTPSNNSTGNIVDLRSANLGLDTGITYQFEVDTTSTLSSPFKRNMTTSTNVFVDSVFFTFNQTLYWRARCFNALGDTFQWSPTWKYTTASGVFWNTSPFVFSVDPMYLVNWTYAGLARIHVQLDTNLNFNTPKLQEHFVRNGIIQDTFANLSFGKNYYVRLRGYYGNSQSAWSAVQAIQIKNTVTILDPNNGQTINSLTPGFSWSQMRGVSFQIQLYSDMAKSAILVDTITTLSNYVSNAELKLNTQYPWRIRAFHALDTLPWAERNFTIFSGKVNISAPTNSATTSVRPRFSFLKFSWATAYVMEIDTGSVWPSSPSAHYIRLDTFSSTGNNLFADTSLLYGQKYIWRVYALKGQEPAEPSIQSFSTFSAPTNYNPPNNFVGTGPQTNGLVNGISGSTFMEWQLDTSNLFNSPLATSGVDPHVPDDFEPKYVLIEMAGDLRFHTKYFWRTRCINAVDTSNWSAAFNFITTQEVWLSSPSNGAVNVPLKAKLDWGLQGSNFNSRYQYQLATDSLLDTKPIISLPKDEISEVDVNLLHGTRYFWRARVLHDKDTSRWSVINYFNTIPPPVIGVPTLVSPAQGALNIPLTPIILSWNFSNNATSFDIEVSTAADFSTINASGNAVGNASQFSGMQAKTRYYWRVRGRNGSFTSAWATRWFETLASNSVNELVTHENRQVFPNPAHLFFTIRCEGEFSVQVSDINGKIIFDKSQILDEIELTTDRWQAGIYFVKIVKNGEATFHKVSVQQ